MKRTDHPGTTGSLGTTGDDLGDLAPAAPAITSFADSFADLELPAAVLRTLTEQGVREPFPIQAATLPSGLAGRDVLGRGRTGSGKTLAFGLPLLTRTAGAARSRSSRSP